MLLFSSPLGRHQSDDGTPSAHNHKGRAAADPVSQLGEPPLGLGNTGALNRHVLKSPHLKDDFKLSLEPVFEHRPLRDEHHSDLAARRHLPASALGRVCSYRRAVDSGMATGRNAQHSATLR
jgi:hypothetical protein